VCLSRTSVAVYETTQRHIQESFNSNTAIRSSDFFFSLVRCQRHSQLQLHRAVVLLEKGQLWSYTKVSQQLMQPEGSLAYSQEPFSDPQPEPDQSNPYHPMPYLRYILIFCLCFPSYLFPLGFPTSILYTVTYTGYMCVVVWQINLRGFGLDTGFIHYGDLQLHRLQLLATDTITHN
jgi:hypothetical protein